MRAVSRGCSTITGWQGFYRVMGLPSRPPLPFYIDGCPYCGKGPTKLSSDKLYSDGWCACTSCLQGRYIIQFLMDYLNKSLAEVLQHYSDDLYLRQVVPRLLAWQEYYTLYDRMADCQLALADSFNLFDKYKLPRVTNSDWEQRAKEYIHIFKEYGFLYKISKVNFDVFIDTVDLPSPLIGTKCYDHLGRMSGFHFYTDDVTKYRFLVTLPYTGKPGITRTELGFGFGDALWRPSIFSQTLGDIFFVVPPNIATNWQLEHLKDHTQLLPVISYTFGDKVEPHQYRRHKLLGYWYAWKDKKFLIWVPKMTERVYDIIKIFNCMYYVGELPQKVQNYNTHLSKLKYILKHAKTYTEDI